MLRMNIPCIKSYHDQAIDIVVSVINKAQEKLGARQNLHELAHTRTALVKEAEVSLTSLGPPLAITSEKFIANVIEKKWRLTDTLMYILKYLGGSQDECSQYYYYEVIFSQPTVAYPVPQATCSVFFRVEDKHMDPPEMKGVPIMVFRIEGHHAEHDVRYVRLCPDWILAVLQMKIKFFKRIEELNMF